MTRFDRSDFEDQGSSEGAPAGGELNEQEIADLPPGEVPPGFEHYRFRTKPEIAEALRRMSLLPEDRRTR